MSIIPVLERQKQEKQASVKDYRDPTCLKTKQSHLYVCTYVYKGAHRGQKRMSEPLEVELQAFVSRLSEC